MSTNAASPPRQKALLDRDFFMVHTIYGISLIFGFEQLGESVYSLSLSYLGTAPVLVAPRSVLILLSGALALLGVRFFWAVDNIFRFIDHCKAKEPAVPHRKLVAIHYPALFLHSFAFFCLCHLDLDLSGASPEHRQAHPYLFLYLYAGLLIGNATWLYFLVRRRDNKEPEYPWMINNVLCGTLAVCLTAILQHCGATIGALWVAFVVFQTNNLVDLFSTSRSYIESPEEPAHPS